MSKTNYRRDMDAIHERIVARLKAEPPDPFLKLCKTCRAKWDVRFYMTCPFCRTRRNGKES